MSDSTTPETAMISDALVVSERRPRRPLISFFTRWYSLIFAVFATLILVVSAFPYAPLWTTLWIALYWFYQASKLLIRNHPILRLRYKSKWIQLGRSLILIASVSIFLAYLYLHTDYLKKNAGADTLWLLFVLATFITSQRGVTELMLAAVGFASLCIAAIDRLAAAHLATTDSLQILALGIAVKVLWLILLSFVLHVLIRYASDWYANARLLHGVEEQIIEIRSISDEKRLLDTAVRRVASDFKYPHVNVFYLQPDRTLKCVAGACSGGQSLAQTGYAMQPGRGIIGHVVETGESHLSNHVAKDPYYYPHSAFPHTQAELVVPIKLRNQVLGVFDIQAHRKDVFLNQDVEVMEIMASHLGRVLDNIRVHSWRHRISTIVESIARRLLSQHELEDTLNEIARAAHEELGADVVVLYERNPLTNTVTGPVCAGDLHHPEVLNRTVVEPDSLVYRLLAAEDDYYFHPDVHEVSDDGLFVPSEYHIRSGDPVFVEREGVASRAVVRLRAGIDCVGLMFLNFRLLRSFDRQEERSTFSIFAHLAALAIQKAQSHQKQMQAEREDLARQLHDQLMASADGASRIISVILKEGPLTDAQKANLTLARSALQELQSDIQYLNDTLKDTSSDDLPQEVEKIAQRVKRAYGIACDVQWAGYDNPVPPAIITQLRPILNETILNAVKHGQATRINFVFKVKNNQVTVTIEDNGMGFDTTRIRPRGIQNMRERTERLGGSFNITSAPNQGTHITITVPIRHARQ